MTCKIFRKVVSYVYYSSGFFLYSLEQPILNLWRAIREDFFPLQYIWLHIITFFNASRTVTPYPFKKKKKRILKIKKIYTGFSKLLVPRTIAAIMN